jgi:hypothetical protein
MMQYGPMTEQEAMDEEQKKREAIRSYLTTKYNEPIQDEPMPDNSNSRILGDLVTNLGSAFEDYGRAGSVARGGARNDGSFYSNVNKQIGSKFDRDEKAVKDANAMKRTNLDDAFKGDSRARQQQEWSDSDADRATKQSEIDLEKDPASQQSLMAQELANRLMPSKDFTGMSAAQLKKSIPTLEKLYAIDARRNDEKKGKTIDQDKIDRGIKKDNFKLTQELRKEYTSHPVTKSSKVLEESFSKIMTTDQTGPGDMALIFNYMKMLDPGSTVREGEFASAVASGGVPSQIAGLYNKVRGDGMLDVKTRNQIRDQSQLYYDKQIERQNQLDSQFQGIAANYGLDFDQVGRTLDRPKAMEKTKSKDEKAIDWAKQNPNDPRAKVILQLGGAQ